MGNTRLVHIGMVMLPIGLVGCEQTTGLPPVVVEPEIPWEVTALAAVNSHGVAVGSATRFVPVAGSDSVQQHAGAVWRLNEDLRIVSEVTAFVDINEAGHAVGFLAQDGSAAARLWTGSANLTELGAFVPIAIGNDGDVIGYVGAGNARTGVLRRSTGTVESLASVGEVASHSSSLVIPLDVANGPLVVGGVGVTSEAFVWSPAEGARLLFPESAGAESHATAVNSHGNIVGWSSTFNTAYVWSPDGNVRPLEPLAGSPAHFWGRACAYDITDSGLVVGRSLSANFSSRAVKWLSDGSVVDLGPGVALAASETGYIVGHNLGGGANHPVVWLPDGTRIDLKAEAASGAQSHTFAPSQYAMSLPC